MAVHTYQTETTSDIPPAILFRAFARDADKLIPLIKPLPLTSTDIINGNGVPQGINSFFEGDIYKEVEHRISMEKVEVQLLTHSYYVVDWFNILGKTSYETKIEASPDGGSILRSTSKYITDYEINEEQVRAGIEKATELFRAVEHSIMAHPDFYN